jgi:hypothetical protein
VADRYWILLLYIFTVPFNFYIKNFANALGAVCYVAELRRLVMISDVSMKNYYQQQLNKLLNVGKARRIHYL